MGFIATLKAALRVSPRRDTDLAYLNAAASRTDLEMRQRELDRRGASLFRND